MKFSSLCSKNCLCTLLILVWGLGACHDQPEGDHLPGQFSSLAGTITYHGQLQSSDLHDWCGFNMASLLNRGESGQLAGTLVTIDSPIIENELPPHLTEKLVPENGTITVNQCRLEPQIIVVSKGGAITIHNTDSQNKHNIYLIYRKAIVGHALLVPGAKSTMPLLEEGFYQLGELRQQQWLATNIYVTAARCFTKTDSSGHFDFGQLPPGPYQVHLRHPILGDIDQAITLENGTRRVLVNNY